MGLAKGGSKGGWSERKKKDSREMQPSQRETGWVVLRYLTKCYLENPDLFPFHVKHFQPATTCCHINNFLKGLKGK